MIIYIEEQSSTTPKSSQSSASIVDNWVTVVTRNTQNQNNEPLPKLSSNQSEILKSIFVEKDERERRKNNLLIFGVKKSSEDLNEAIKQVESIFSTIGIAPSLIAHSRRSRKNDVSKPALIFVLLSKGTDKYKVIIAAKRLRKSTELKHVFINPDRTKAERELGKQLLQKRDFLNKEEEGKHN